MRQYILIQDDFQAEGMCPLHNVLAAMGPGGVFTCFAGGQPHKFIEVPVAGASG